MHDSRESCRLNAQLPPPRSTQQRTQAFLKATCGKRKNRHLRPSVAAARVAGPLRPERRFRPAHHAHNHHGIAHCTMLLVCINNVGRRRPVHRDDRAALGGGGHICGLLTAHKQLRKGQVRARVHCLSSPRSKQLGLGYDTPHGVRK